MNNRQNLGSRAGKKKKIEFARELIALRDH